MLDEASPPEFPAPHVPPDAPKPPPKARLFLSYARADGKELAARLHHDLEALGYAVWQDIEPGAIPAGSAWQLRIEEALHQSQALIAVMTPFAVRSALHASDASESVCLDEISFARFQRPPTPIVPVMGIECDPPLVIYRLDYVDIRDWKSEERYRAGFERLLAGLEAALAGRVQYRPWDEFLAPLDFATVVNQKRQHFCGRAWLFEEIDRWRQQSQDRALLILGDPGAGKSALVAELVFRNPGGQVLAYHFCQAETKVTLEPGRFVRSAAAMIATRVPAYAAALGRASVSAALSAANCDADPGSALEMGILAPLAQVPAPESGNQYFLVDALDEALLGGKRGFTIVDLLAPRLDRFPPWLRVVATSRRDPEVLRRLQGLRAKLLDSQGAENLADVSAYLQTRLEEPAFAMQLERSHKTKEDVVQELRVKSAGNFLYLQKVFEGLERGAYRFENLGTLPPALAGLYTDYFDRRFPDEQTYRGPRAVLEVVAAAREPLTANQIALASGLDRNREVLVAIAALSGYISESYDEQSAEARYSLYHRSLSDWLTVSLPNHSNDRHLLDLVRGRDGLLALCRRWRATGDHYAFAHFAEHLADAGASDELHALLTDADFLASQRKVLSEYVEIDDYRLLTTCLLQTKRDDQLTALAVTGNPFQRDGVISALRDAPAEAAGRIAGMVQGWLRQRSGTGNAFNAKLAAIRLAYFRGMPDALELASRDSSEEVRDMLVPYLYRLWRDDPAAGYKFLDDLLVRSQRQLLRIDLPALQVAAGLSLMILAMHQDPEVTEPLRLSWSRAAEHMRESVLFRVANSRLLLRILVGALKMILAHQPEFQPLNLQEVVQTYSRPPAYRREALAALEGLAHPQTGYHLAVEMLLKRNRPYDVFEMLMTERLFIYQGVRDPEGVLEGLEHVHREGCSWYGQSVIYAGFHVLSKAPSVRDEWLDRYAAMSREIVMGAAEWRTTHGTYVFTAPMAFTEAVFAKRRPSGHAQFLPALYVQAMDRGDHHYALQVIAAAKILGADFGFPQTALDVLREPVRSADPRLRAAVLQTLAKIRFFHEAAVDHFLDEQATPHFRRHVRMATPEISSRDFPTWLDEATIRWLLHSDDFRERVVDYFERSARARSVAEVLSMTLKWGINMIAQRTLVPLD
jgi:TIR domain